MLVPTALLMLKAPIDGAVKTRLARDIGAAAATRAYRALVEHQLRQIPPEWRVHICFAPKEALPTMRAWLGEQYEYSAQAEGDLGARLVAATAQHFARSDGLLILLGGDCPYLSRKRLLDAASGLREADAVVVPAVDGGYCLLALRRPDVAVFRAISWSTPAVLAQTRQRLHERGLQWTELETAEDVDDGASWQRAQRAFPELDDCAK